MEALLLAFLNWMMILTGVGLFIAVFMGVWLVMNAAVGGRKAPEFESENETWVSVEVFAPDADSRGKR